MGWRSAGGGLVAWSGDWSFEHPAAKGQSTGDAQEGADRVEERAGKVVGNAGIGAGQTGDQPRGHGSGEKGTGDVFEPDDAGWKEEEEGVEDGTGCQAEQKVLSEANESGR